MTHPDFQPIALFMCVRVWSSFALSTVFSMRRTHLQEDESRILDTKTISPKRYALKVKHWKLVSKKINVKSYDGFML